MSADEIAEELKEEMGSPPNPPPDRGGNGGGNDETDEDEEELVRETEIDDKPYVCPKCGEKVSFFKIPSGGHTPQCPSCHKWIKKDSVPKESIVRVRKKETTKEKEESEEEGKPESFFKKPKEPHEVLKNLMEEWEFSDSTIRKLVSHSKSVGGIHPIDLREMLTKIEGGPNNNADANIFTKQYEISLRKERKKAANLNYDISYPLPYSQNERGRRSGYEMSSPSPRSGGRSQPRGNQPQGGGGGISSNINELVQVIKAVDKLRGGNERNQPRDDVMTKSEFKKLMLEQENDQLKKTVNGLRDEMSQLRQTVNNQPQRRPASEGDYKQDEFRLIADTIHEVKDTIDNKEPVKLLIKGMSEQEERAPSAKETERSESNVHKYVNKEYVEEGRPENQSVDEVAEDEA